MVWPANKLWWLQQPVHDFRQVQCTVVFTLNAEDLGHHSQCYHYQFV